MAMVAMLEVVAPVLPGPVQVEVRRLIDLHNLAWRDPGAETQSGADGGFDEFRRQARMAAYHAGERTIEPTVKPLSQEQAIATWTELQRLISVGAYEERSAEHHETGTWPEDGVEESVANLETWAERQGLEFCFNHDSKTWSLAPIEIRSEDGV